MNDNKAIIKAEIYIGKGFLILFSIFFAILFAMAFMGTTFIIFITFMPPFILVALVYLICNSIARRSEIILHSRGISGIRKHIFSETKLELTMDKIDSIMITTTLRDHLFGGKTIVIRSNSGKIKFPWVHNAEEFMQATLAEIEKYKKNVAQQTPAPQAPVQVVEKDNSAMEKMRELKTMLDEGFITQEEFDAKKKDLLDKM